MLTADVRFEGWTAEDWQRFLSLWKPRAAAAPDPSAGERPHGGLFLIHDGVRVRKLLHTSRGRIPPPPWPLSLEQLAETHHASWVIAAHFGAMDETMERFGARARRQDDAITQTLSLLGIIREMTAEGAYEPWPRRFEHVPTPSEGMVLGALDSVCKNGRSIVLGMFKDGELWTSFVARRRGTGFDVIAGPDELRPAMGFLSGDWRRDYRHLVHAVEDRYGPLAFGCFGDVDSFRALELEARPGGWSRAVAVRDIVIAPVPAAVGVALGFDTARFVFESAKAVTRRLDPMAMLEPAVHSARRRLGRGAGKRELEAVLGFDPIALLRELLKK